MPIQALTQYLAKRRDVAVDKAIKRLRQNAGDTIPSLTVEQLRSLYTDILDAMANALTSCELDRWHSSLQPFARQLLQIQPGLSPLLEQMLILRLAFREDLIAWYGDAYEKLPETVEVAEHFFDNFLLAGARVYERESKRQIKEADLRHTTFFENMVFPAFLADASGLLLRINPEMSRLLNDKTGRQIQTRHVCELLCDLGVEAEQVGAYLSRIESDRKVQRLPLRAMDTNQEVRYFEISSAYRYNSDGEAVGIQGFLEDVTQKRLSEIRLQEQRHLLQAIFDNAPIGLMAVDENRRLQHLNTMFLSNLHVPEEKIEALRQAVTDQTCIAALDHIVAQSPGSGEAANALKSALTKCDGSKRFEITIDPSREVLFFTAPLRQNFEGPNGLIVLSQDVSHERQLEKLRDDLTHMVVHDLKTPLTAIQGANANLRLHLSNDRSRIASTSLDVIARSVNNMTRMVSNLLNISRLEQKQLPLKLEETDPAGLICDMRSDLKSMAEGRKTRLPKKPIGHTVKVDPELMRRVIENIFYNAIKHTDGNGCVEIRVRKRKDGGATISVKDNGEGIPQESRKQIFEKFEQAQARSRGRRTDTGLGLTFCKLAIEAHGGRIDLQSEVGRGSTFTLQIPNRPPSDNT